MTKKLKSLLISVVALTLLIFAALFIFLSGKEDKSNVYAFGQNQLVNETSDVDYFDTYAVGETIVIANDKENPTYAVLQKDYNVLKAVNPDEAQATYEFTEKGKYNLIYFTVNQEGVRTVKKNIGFTVNDQPYFNAIFDSEYLVNNTLELSAQCVFGKEKTDANVTTVSPSGTVSAEESLSLSECGVYKITYSADISGISFSRTYYVSVTGKADSFKDYILPVIGVTGITENVDTPDYAVDGVGLRVETEGFGSFRFNNVIDLNSLTVNQNLISIMPIGDGGYSPLKTLTVKLIDAYDSDNVISYVLAPVYSWAYEEVEWAYCKIQYKDTQYAVRTDGRGDMFINTIYGAGTSVAFNGELLKSKHGGGQYYGRSPWFLCQVDYADKAFYAYSGRYENSKQTLILDLDQPKQVGYGNEWAGFTTGEVYLQVELTGTGSVCGCLIQEIAGEKMYGEKIDSQTGLGMFFDVENAGFFPTGQVGTYYPFPKVSYSVDTFDGKTYNPEYQIISLERVVVPEVKYESLTVDGNGFIPEKAGDYIIAYTTEDSQGNVGMRNIVITVKQSLGEKRVDFGVDDSYCVGNYFTVPEVTTQGLSYLLKENVSITYDGQEYCSRIGEEVFLSNAGQIKIKCEYEDYLGQTYSSEKIVEVSVSDKPIVTLLGVIPKYAVKGRTIVLPSISAIDYTSGFGQDSAWSLWVDGQSVDTVERSVTVNKNHGEKINVEYRIGDDVVYQSSITVVEANYLSDRFYVTKGNADIKDSDTGVIIKSDGGGSVDYINPIIANESVETIPLTIGKLLDAEFNGYLDIYYEDYMYPEIKFFVRVSYLNNAFYATINGQGTSFLIQESIDSDDVYSLEYDKQYNSFEFESRLVVKTDVYGKQFDGFPSNRINISFVFGGTDDITGVEIRSLSSIRLASTYKNGVIQKYSDRMKPQLVSEGSYLENSFEYGTTVYLPAVEARTVLSGLTTATVKVTAPSGKTVLEECNAYNAQSFVIDEFGEYIITYKTPFLSTTQTINNVFRVFQEKIPEVDIKTALKQFYKVGDTLTVPDVAVVDNTGEYSVEIFIALPDGSTQKVKVGDTLKLENVGYYKLKVMVIDQHNITFRSWSFAVGV